MTSAGGPVNDDRAGAAGGLAWVIDGATDLVSPPLTGTASDAAWLAAEMDALLRSDRRVASLPLSDVPAYLAGHLAQAFAKVRQRLPAGQEEYPSAAAVIVRATPEGLDYVTLGDCVLIAQDRGKAQYIGVEEEAAGDRWAVDEIGAYLARDATATLAAARQDLWTKFATVRARMNIDGGYGIFTITPPRPALVRSGRLTLGAGGRVLLATDGLSRLVDVFRRYDHGKLLDAASTHGLSALLEELRAIETADDECLAFPRTKVSDDATGILLRYT